MSVKLMSQVWEADLPPTQKLIMLSLADHANDAGFHVYPSLAVICTRTGLSERAVRTNLRQLETMGMIYDTQDRTPRGVHIYAINVHVLAQSRGAADAPLPPSGGQQMPPRGAADAPGGAADAPPPLESSYNHQGNERDAAAIWKSAQDNLRQTMTADAFERSIHLLKLSGWSGDGALRLVAPNPLVHEWVQVRLHKLLSRALAPHSFALEIHQ